LYLCCINKGWKIYFMFCHGCHVVICFLYKAFAKLKSNFTVNRFSKIENRAVHGDRDRILLLKLLEDLKISSTKIYHWINSKLNSDRKTLQKVMKYNIKNLNLRGS
jgi:hypothetical protein